MKNYIVIGALLAADPVLAQAGRKFSTSWPKRFETKYVSIPKAGEDDYWMDGWYCTLLNQVGDLQFEFAQTLHIPRLNNNWHYQLWAQTKDEKTDTKYEGWAFTIKNIIRAQRSLLNADYWRLGLYGDIKLEKEPNNPHSNIAALDQTTQYPWTTVDDQLNLPMIIKSKKTMIGPANGQPGQARLVQVRKFETAFSRLQLKVGTTFKMSQGYRIYTSGNAKKVEAKGATKEPFTITVIKQEASGASNLLVAASITAIFSSLF